MTAQQSSPSRPIYTPDQISTFFTHISLPLSSRSLALQHPPPSNPLHANPALALAFLTQLQRHTLATVPFENLQLHYSRDHTVCLDTGFLYEKIVKRGRGGYCMENNCFFGTVLRSLGFEVWSVGARVSRGVGRAGEEGWLGWSHMVNVVRLGDGGGREKKRYMVDVGFGGMGPVQPMLLDEEGGAGGGGSVMNIEPAEGRVVWGDIAQTTDREQRLWQYQHRFEEQAEWQPVYCFTELEFLPEDYEIMSFWTSQSRKSFFTYNVVAVKMILEGEEVVGTLILEGGEVKRRVKGKTEYLRTCRFEEERVQALEEVFGLRLTDEERRGIGGMVTELKG